MSWTQYLLIAAAVLWLLPALIVLVFTVYEGGWRVLLELLPNRLRDHPFAFDFTTALITWAFLLCPVFNIVVAALAVADACKLLPDLDPEVETVWPH